MIPRILISLLLLTGFITAPHALERTLSAQEVTLIRAIGEHNSAIKTMAGRFLQIDSAGGRVEGTFFIQRPGKVRFRYAPPSREEIVSSGDGFYLLNREERTKLLYPRDKVPLRQFLTDNIDFLNANISDVVMTDTFISIGLIDESPIGTVEVSLIFEIASLELWQWTLIEPNGSELTFSLYDVEKDLEIPRPFFYVDATYRTVSN